ncbi:NADPH-dependent pterin aldehyde reductase-like isoform X2 [Momordica charantia]|uniref:NADPH-dependent pterin aldehyde reductase-like isoform X2 n=1 Tax=Momordica charantia TaxID=3673 RepID=A0A6J1DNL5_MOMCH|nr:NADPH-dependent pterin aldehyde reductase-like isoform X2 [Momordica charantia]
MPRSANGSDASFAILITGVSKGIGRALALECAKRGHTIIGCSRSQDKLDSLRTQLLSPDKHLLFNTDTSNSSVQDLVNAVLERNLIPDILVNNAAVVNEKSKFWEIPMNEFDSVIDTNVKGTANVLRHFIPLMIASEKRIIVNMSSEWGRMGAPMFSPYSTSKWAIEGLTKSIAPELPEGMAIIALHPGVINTDMLVTCFGDLAANYQTPEPWAVKASTMILNFTSADNGASLSVDE